MSTQLFLLLAVFVVSSIAYRTLPPHDKATPELLAAGMKQEYIDQFFNFERDRRARVVAAWEEEKKTGKKGLQEAAKKKNEEAMVKMHSSWPEKQDAILSNFIVKYLA
ncbi:hypothetical protein CAEBREN_05718 [Caenorhabditis brenneri]|uniref:Uncharacterized protein n=1 Tax=Caenorhabditis brenneri TaxID=135651 RepID=G0NCP4_CAEBE|nr:hypothetical protein CAEBREN_05718 [Caenorhabditis brenneri]